LLYYNNSYLKKKSGTKCILDFVRVINILYITSIGIIIQDERTTKSLLLKSKNISIGFFLLEYISLHLSCVRFSIINMKRAGQMWIQGKFNDKKSAIGKLKMCNRVLTSADARAVKPSYVNNKQ